MRAVTDQPVQIFMSYARADNVPPPDDANSKGFVTALDDWLRYSFQTSGDRISRIWRDVRKVEDGDQFDRKIGDAINESALLLVVLSPNWMLSDFCRQELAAFAERWKGDPNGGRDRIIVAMKRHVGNDERPDMLQRQEGFRFYALDETNDIQPEIEFFKRGKAADDRYFQELEKLAGFLTRRTKQLAARTDKVDAKGDPAAAADRTKTVFLAKPAADMRQAYDRLATELRSSGFAVVPDIGADIPNDSGAIKFIDDALGQTDISIHLVGDKQGFAPEEADPIVKLQLKRAAARIAAGSQGRFQRLIWAPKFVPGQEEGAIQATARNPVEVLSRLDNLLEIDAIEGDTLARFVEFVAQRLSKLAAPAPAIDGIDGNQTVYVYYRPDDAEYGYNICRALKAREVTPRWPAFEGTDAERVQVHRQNLRECDSVVLCWASAPDAWVRSMSSELVDWKLLGRTKNFFRRALVAGPPPGMPKKMFVEFHSKDAIDVILDLTAREQPQPDDMTPLIAAE